MKIKNILAICAIAILAIGFMNINRVNASKIDIDADWRLVTNFKIFDVTSSELIWDKDVAAGDAHENNFGGQAYKFHQISITVTPYGATTPGSICVINNVYDGGNIKVYANLKFRLGQYYKFWLDGYIGNNMMI